jgi:hypothetical protein
MLLLIAGGLLALLGLLAAVLLVLEPLGWVATASGWSLWVFFPVFTLLGYTLLAVGSKDPAVKAPTLLLAAPLLLLALLAAAALVGAGAGLLNLATSASLWYVLTLGGTLGVLGAAVRGRHSGA